MKNVTLSLPDETLRKIREYAKNHGTTLNEMVREYLKRTINEQNQEFEVRIHQSLDQMGVDTANVKFTRDELHER